MENGERFTAKLWVKFGEQWRSKERARARWTKLATGAQGGRVSGERGEAERKWTRPLCSGRRRGDHACAGG